jgi:hypothetical protein
MRLELREISDGITYKVDHRKYSYGLKSHEPNNLHRNVPTKWNLLFFGITLNQMSSWFDEL